MGRKPIISPAIIEKVCWNIQKSIPYKYSALIGGISESTLYDWIEKGEALHGVDESELSESQKLYVEFAEEVKKAKALSVSDAVTVINTASSNSWQAAAWMLERRCPEDFGRHDRVEHSGQINGQMTLVAKDLGRMSPEEQEAHAAKLRQKMNLLDSPKVTRDEEE